MVDQPADIDIPRATASVAEKLQTNKEGTETEIEWNERPTEMLFLYNVEALRL